MDSLDQKLRAVVAQFEALQAELARPESMSDPDALRRLGKEMARILAQAPRVPTVGLAAGTNA